MIKFRTGNILKSDADAIVNTVNCEGYMGKGIAYQFKLEYPENNKAYIKECNSGRFKIGSILPFYEGGKLIINFPTKDKWRKKSEYSYIQDGLSTLIDLLPKLNIRSIAFPPLGCGNGGLEWVNVKDILLNELSPLDSQYDFILYEPSSNVGRIVNRKKAPKLTASHLLLMKLKLGLAKFNKTRLQKGAFLINIFSGENYFKFNAYNFGPYNHTIDILSRDIKEYQEYYNFTTQQAFDVATNTLVSASLLGKMKKYSTPTNNVIEFLNRVSTDRELELITTILFIINDKNINRVDLIPNEFKKWSLEKASKFSIREIELEIEYLKEVGILSNSLYGIEINNQISDLKVDDFIER